MSPERRATVVELAAAAAAGAALAALAPAGDPFRGTLLIAPAVAAALRAIGRHAGARGVGLHEGRIAGVFFGALLILILTRAQLGLVVTDGFLAAGLALVLAHRAARLLVGLRPLLGRQVPRRPPVAFFLLPAVIYLALQPWAAAHRQPDGDEPYYLLLSHSLAYDLDLDLSNNYANRDWRRFMTRELEPQPGDPVDDRGSIYSRHSFLLPLALAPAYRVAGRAGAMAMMALLAAAVAWMMLRLGHHYAPGRPDAALLAYAILAFSPPLVVYSYQIWAEVPAALLLALALDRILALRHAPLWEWRSIALAAAPVVLLPLLKFRLGLISASLLLIAWQRARAGKLAAIGALGGLVVALGTYTLWNTARFGNPLRIYSTSELDLFRYPPADFLRGAVGMFYDGAFGLFPNAPIYLLLVPALALLAVRRGPLLTDLAVIATPYLLFIAPRLEWYGGWSPPFRYPLVFLPLLALALVPLLARRRRPALRMLVAALAAATLVLTVVWLVHPGWTFNFADGRSQLADRASVRLGGDAARVFPSVVRPRAATWVWLGGSLLLVPLALYAGGRGRGRRGLAGGRPATRWGIAVALAAAALLTAAVRVWPTRVIHFEDPYVGHRRGQLHPPPWTLQRPLYTGGWKVPANGAVAAPVVAGGERVTIRLAYEQYGIAATRRLWVGAGETHLATILVDERGPRDVVLGPFDWPRGAPLVVRDLAGPAGGSVLLDRAELRWQ